MHPSLDEDWNNFLTNNDEEEEEEDEEAEMGVVNTPCAVPKSTPIYISTKTKIAYLNTSLIDIKTAFWKIDVMPYHKLQEGVIKKQMKFSTTSQEELEEIEKCVNAERMKGVAFVDTQMIEHIDNPDGRIKFKDQRKINIGLSKKDILNCRCKKKRAFFNCFVIIVRIQDELHLDKQMFKEMHIKIFNTGKLEIPGVQNDASINNVIKLLIDILKPAIGQDLDYTRNKCETVLINSNFNCGYYIDRDKLYNILKYKYRINSNYDSCSYPGIQCKFFYNTNINASAASQTGQQPATISESDAYIEISFMIFRTGSVLIVGKCEDVVLHNIYEVIKEMLYNEYQNICTINVNEHTAAHKKHVSKIRQRVIINTF